MADLIGAIQDGNIAKVEALLKSGIDPNQEIIAIQDNRIQIPLMVAIASYWNYKDLSIISLLLSHKADVCKKYIENSVYVARTEAYSNPSLRNKLEQLAKDEAERNRDWYKYKPTQIIFPLAKVMELDASEEIAFILLEQATRLNALDASILLDIYITHKYIFHDYPFEKGDRFKVVELLFAKGADLNLAYSNGYLNTNYGTLLIGAVYRKKEALVNYLLSKSANPLQKGRISGWYDKELHETVAHPLFFAIRYNYNSSHNKTIALLIEAGAKITKDERQLLLSFMRNKLLLIKNKVVPEYWDDDSLEPIINAANEMFAICQGIADLQYKKTFQKMKALLEAGAHINQQQAKTLRTPLHFSAERGDLLIINFLMQHNADVMVKDILGETPIDLLVENGCVEIAKYLSELHKCRKETARKIKKDPSLFLEELKNRGQEFIVEQLLAENSLLYVPEQKTSQSTQLANKKDSVERADATAPVAATTTSVSKEHQGAESSKEATLAQIKTNTEQLLQEIAGVEPGQRQNLIATQIIAKAGAFDLTIFDQHKHSVSFYAKNYSCGSEAIVALEKFQQQLIKEQPHFALLQAILVEDLQTTVKLLQAGFSINGKNSIGENALHLAVRAGNLKTLNLLAVNGARITALNDNKQTPLMLAKAIDNKPAIIFLQFAEYIETHGFKFIKLDVVHSVSGHIPLTLAAASGNIEIMACIAALGGSLDTLNQLGDTALSVARNAGQFAAVKWLVEHGVNLATIETSSDLLSNDSLALEAEQEEILEEITEEEAIPASKEIITNGAVFSKVTTKPSGNCLFEAIIKAIDAGNLPIAISKETLLQEVTVEGLSPKASKELTRVDLERIIQALRNKVANALISLRAANGDVLENPSSIINQVTSAFLDLLAVQELAGCPEQLLSAISVLREQVKLDKLYEQALVAYRKNLSPETEQTRLAETNKLIAELIKAQKAKTIQFIKDTGFTSYVNAVKEYGFWGGSLELRLLARMLNVYITVYGPEETGGVLEEVDFNGTTQIIARHSIISPNPADDLPLQAGQDIVIPEQAAVVTLYLEGQHYSAMLPGRIAPEIMQETEVVATELPSLEVVEEIDDYLVCSKFLIQQGFTELTLETPHPQTGQLPIIMAAGLGNVEALASIIKKQELNIIDPHGMTALMMAALAGQLNAVVWLVSNGANIRLTNKDGETAKAIANKAGHELISYFLEFAAFVQAQGFSEYELNNPLSNGETYLSYAIKTNNKALLSVLEKLWPLGIDVNILNEAGFSALQIAVLQQNITAVQWLIEAGANINLINSYGDTALDLAVKTKNETLIKYLETQQAVPTTTFSCLAEQENLSPSLITFLTRNSLSAVDLNATNIHLETALIAATRENAIELVQEILQHPKIAINAVDINGVGALWWAAFYGNQPVIEILLAQKELIIDIAAKDGRTPFVVAYQQGHIKLAELLQAKDTAVPVSYLDIAKPALPFPQTSTRLFAHKEDLPIVFYVELNNETGIDNLFASLAIDKESALAQLSAYQDVAAVKHHFIVALLYYLDSAEGFTLLPEALQNNKTYQTINAEVIKAKANLHALETSIAEAFNLTEVNHELIVTLDATGKEELIAAYNLAHEAWQATQEKAEKFASDPEIYHDFVQEYLAYDIPLILPEGLLSALSYIYGFELRLWADDPFGCLQVIYHQVPHSIIRAIDLYQTAEGDYQLLLPDPLTTTQIKEYTLALQALEVMPFELEQQEISIEQLSCLHDFNNAFFHPGVKFDFVELRTQLDEETYKAYNEQEELPIAMEYEGLRQLSTGLLENHKTIQVRIERVQKLLAEQVGVMVELPSQAAEAEALNVALTKEQHKFADLLELLSQLREEQAENQQLIIDVYREMLAIKPDNLICEAFNLIEKRAHEELTITQDILLGLTEKQANLAHTCMTTIDVEPQYMLTVIERELNITISLLPQLLSFEQLEMLAEEMKILSEQAQAMLTGSAVEHNSQPYLLALIQQEVAKSIQQTIINQQGFTQIQEHTAQAVEELVDEQDIAEHEAVEQLSDTIDSQIIALSTELEALPPIEEKLIQEFIQLKQSRQQLQEELETAKSDFEYIREMAQESLQKVSAAEEVLTKAQKKIKVFISKCQAKGIQPTKDQDKEGISDKFEAAKERHEQLAEEFHGYKAMLDDAKRRLEQTAAHYHTTEQEYSEQLERVEPIISQQQNLRILQDTITTKANLQKAAHRAKQTGFIKQQAAELGVSGVKQQRLIAAAQSKPSSTQQSVIVAKLITTQEEALRKLQINMQTAVQQYAATAKRANIVAPSIGSKHVTITTNHQRLYAAAAVYSRLSQSVTSPTNGRIIQLHPLLQRIETLYGRKPIAPAVAPRIDLSQSGHIKGMHAEHMTKEYLKSLGYNVDWATKYNGNRGIDVVATEHHSCGAIKAVLIVEVKFEKNGYSIKLNTLSGGIKQMDRDWMNMTLANMAQVSNPKLERGLQKTLDLLREHRDKIEYHGVKYNARGDMLWGQASKKINALQERVATFRFVDNDPRMEHIKPLPNVKLVTTFKGTAVKPTVAIKQDLQTKAMELAHQQREIVRQGHQRLQKTTTQSGKTTKPQAVVSRPGTCVSVPRGKLPAVTVKAMPQIRQEVRRAQIQARIRTQVAANKTNSGPGDTRTSGSSIKPQSIPKQALQPSKVSGPGAYAPRFSRTQPKPYNVPKPIMRPPARTQSDVVRCMPRVLYARAALRPTSAASNTGIRQQKVDTISSQRSTQQRQQQQQQRAAQQRLQQQQRAQAQRAAQQRQQAQKLAQQRQQQQAQQAARQRQQQQAQAQQRQQAQRATQQRQQQQQTQRAAQQRQQQQRASQQAQQQQRAAQQRSQQQQRAQAQRAAQQRQQQQAQRAAQQRAAQVAARQAASRAAAQRAAQQRQAQMAAARAAQQRAAAQAAAQQRAAYQAQMASARAAAARRPPPPPRR